MQVNNPNNLDTIPIADLLPTQGKLKDLTKSNYKKLKNVIENRGFSVPVYVWEDGSGVKHLLDGHQRRQVLTNEGWAEPIPYLKIPAKDLQEAMARLLEITSQYATITQEGIDEFIATYELNEADVYEATSFDALGKYGDTEDVEVEEDEAPDADETETPKSELGKIYQLGKHRVMCGDSTDASNVALLMDGVKADMVFTDPPYGMKKENDGVINDNLNYNDLLDFNKLWIPNTFDFMKETGSWYCWGIDEPLMDIYSCILKPMCIDNKITFRNLITWDKGHGQGQSSDLTRSYAIADEKCLFVMGGVQGFNNNSDNYYEGWEPIRLYLVGEMEKIGGRKAWEGALGNQMGSHYFTKSQWVFPTREAYQKLQIYGKEVAFKKDYDALKKDYDALKSEWQDTRAYFDNTHDNMNNVWHFDRTSQKERVDTGEHATPKPIELCSRGIKSSSMVGEIVLDVFLGSGSTLIACEQTSRICYGMELDPRYIDVIRKRYAKFTNGNELPDNWEELTPEIAIG